ncbi:ABC transporter permease [Acidithiobacillus sp. M4-SHS-6]|uniref:ABC transporter permease n=1 Tax=Acidithiobacillus sp. M4-SHS-6 TaxID=3383024 RepID=UPI0039BE2E0A
MPRLPSLAIPLPNRRDLIALTLLLGLILLIVQASHRMAVPFQPGQVLPISLSPLALPEYALYTVLRMLAALLVSLLFTFGYAILAAKNRYAEKILIPLLDVLQSVPILGYLSITVTGFMALFPGSLLGLQLAVIFAVFTSQVWNMIFSLYMSLKTVPKELQEAAALYRLNGWQRFWKLELPFAMPGLIWNTMMSMSGGWFFVVAAEAITVAGQRVMVPGIGSYIATAITQRDLGAIFWAIAAMLLVILLYDWLLFRPLVAWADKFKQETVTGDTAPRSSVRTFLQRTRLLRWALLLPAVLWEWSVRILPPPSFRHHPLHPDWERWIDRALVALLALGGAAALWALWRFLPAEFGWREVLHVLFLGLLTATRVFVLVLLSSLLWVPVGVWIGLRPRMARRVQPLAQFLAAFPANLFFPLVVVLIIHFHLNVNIWTSPLMILGSQWYILFNVIGGASALPNDLLEITRNLGVRGWQLWRRLLLPAVFPAYVTGAITASGGAWNASIVAEVVSWGKHTLVAKGLGAFITEATARGNLHQVALGVGVMSLFVIIINRLFWRRLYRLAETRWRLDY